MPLSVSLLSYRFELGLRLPFALSINIESVESSKLDNSPVVSGRTDNLRFTGVTTCPPQNSISAFHEVNSSLLFNEPPFLILLSDSFFSEVYRIMLLFSLASILVGLLNCIRNLLVRSKSSQLSSITSVDSSSISDKVLWIQIPIFSWI